MFSSKRIFWNTIFSVRKIIVTGSNQFDSYPVLEERLRMEFSKHKEVEILCGINGTVDKMVKKFAHDFGFNFQTFPIEFNRFQQAALYVRNKSMLFVADECILFWDGASPGTRMMKELAEKQKVPLNLVPVPKKKGNQNPLGQQDYYFDIKNS